MNKPLDLLAGREVGGMGRRIAEKRAVRGEEAVASKLVDYPMIVCKTSNYCKRFV